jgi:serine/threonine protein kinase
LGARIGHGGAADVHEGFDVRLGREVAVKLFRPGADPWMEERFAEEAVLLARMQHPGLVTVYDAGRHRERAYLVMQLIKGRTLSARLAAGPLPAGRVVELGAALGHALAHVHASGIVHRDVKPSNVLLDASGAPHLADFGIARPVNATRRTDPDVLVGTAAYLAPEQVMGKAVGPSADIYALGLVLLECLKGELEYEGTPLESAVARLHREPVVPPGVPQDLARLLGAMTAHEERERPDAEHCARTLSALRTDRRTRMPVTFGAGEPPTGTLRASRTRHTRRRTASAVLAALSATLTVTLAVAPGTSETSGGRADSGSPTSVPAKPPGDTAVPGAPSAADPQSPTPASRSTSTAPPSPGSSPSADTPRQSPGKGGGPSRQDPSGPSSRAGRGAQPNTAAPGARKTAKKDRKAEGLAEQKRHG